MRLKARDSEANSSSLSPAGTRAARSPPRTRSAAATSEAIGFAMRVAKVRPTQTAPVSSNRPTAEEDQGECDLVIRALAFKLLVLGDRTLGLLHMVDDIRIDEAAGIKIDVAIALEPHQGADAIVIVIGHHRDVAGARRGERPIRHRLQFEREAEAGAREQMPLPVEDDRLGQRAQRRLRAHHFIETLRVEAQEIGVAVEVVRHADDIGADRLLMLV